MKMPPTSNRAHLPTVLRADSSSDYRHDYVGTATRIDCREYCSVSIYVLYCTYLENKRTTNPPVGIWNLYTVENDCPMTVHEHQYSVLCSTPGQ